MSDDQPVKRAWWLSTRRRRAEWQVLIAAGTALFSGKPRAHFQAARPGDPVLVYVSRPDHAIRAVGIVTTSNGREVAKAEQGEGSGAPAASIEVQLAFDLPNPLPWKEILGAPELAPSEPVRKRSSGTLFALTGEEYATLRDMIASRNPELGGAFGAIGESYEAIGALQAEEVPDTDSVAAPATLREEQGSYLTSDTAEQAGLPPVRSLADLQELTGLPLALLKEAHDLLLGTRQIVLIGPPGTGKTWLARGLAALAAQNPYRVQVVQFHPSVTYEDFIEGLKPVVDEMGRVSYAVLPGLFVRLCDRARREPDHLHVLVIDEVNRAPLARVFGELLYALEYRGSEGAVELSVSGGQGPGRLFTVPENLLLVGTMNSTDRSLALVDYALRRRFRFIELEPSAAVLERWLEARGNSREARRIVVNLMERVNRRISEELDEDHRLGHSYFMLDPLNQKTLERLWRTAIRPLIREYFLPPSGQIEEFGEMFAEAAGKLSSTGGPEPIDF